MRFPKLILPASSVDEAPTESICINRDWIPIIMSLVERLEFATAWEAATDMDRARTESHTLVYLLVNALIGCGDLVSCQTYPMTSPRITWYPESPYAPGEDVPPGYTFHPWTVVDDSLIGTIIGSWGLGYRVGDVYTDLTKIPDGDWFAIIEGRFSFPRFRVEDLEGEGTVKVHFLNIPQGGRALIVVDDHLDLLNLQLVELNKDLGSFPQETQTPVVIEVEITGAAAVHHIDVHFLPTVDDTPLPLFFGGGVREIELCGFGLEGCPDMAEGCCDETNDLLRQMLTIMQGGFKLVPITSELPSDFTVDCSPPEFSGNEDDTVPEQIMRHNAMCLTITRWLVSILANKAVKMNQSGKLNDIWALGGMLSAPDMYGQIQPVEVAFTVQYLTDMLADDTAFSLMVCAALAQLSGESNSFVNFKKQFEEIYDAVSTEENVALTLWAFLARAYSTSRYNYEVFAHGLDDAFTELENGLEFECACITGGACDPADFELIPVNDCTVERLTDTTWRITQTNYTDAPPDKRQFLAIFRDTNWRCMNHTTSTQGQAGYDQYDCDGDHLTGVGGGGGLVVQEGIIVLEYDTDPVVGIDTIVTIICP